MIFNSNYANNDIEEFKEILKDILYTKEVQNLENYVQHISSSRYSHCLNVAYYTFLICKKLKLNYVSATRGAMLHDLYFYDWDDKTIAKTKFSHLFNHPKIALNNANRIFKLNALEKDIIVNHMWPVTIKFPKHFETYIVTFVDKYCASIEFFRFVKSYKLFRERKNEYDKSSN